MVGHKRQLHDNLVDKHQITSLVFRYTDLRGFDLLLRKLRNNAVKTSIAKFLVRLPPGDNNYQSHGQFLITDHIYFYTFNFLF